MTYIAACQKERPEAWHGGEKIQQHEKGVHKKQPGTILYAIKEKANVHASKYSQIIKDIGSEY